MSENKHTYTILESNSGTYFIRDENGIELCANITLHGEARRIAASEAMLEALETMKEVFSRETVSVRGQWMPDQIAVGGVYEKVDAAIAAARGEA